ncbi:unnamed protein product, partial [Discosporangium mesarthrocarpum]
MRFRQKNAGAFFLEGRLCQVCPAVRGASYDPGKLVGLVCGTRSPSTGLDHDSMHGHDPTGPTLCIHSVAVEGRYRRRGIASALVKAYMEQVALTQPGVRRVCLISKAPLLGMYAACGFHLVGLSPIMHGRDPWFEMRMDLDQEEPRMMPFLQ